MWKDRGREAGEHPPGESNPTSRTGVRPRERLTGGGTWGGAPSARRPQPGPGCDSVTGPPLGLSHLAWCLWPGSAGVDRPAAGRWGGRSGEPPSSAGTDPSIPVMVGGPGLCARRPALSTRSFPDGPAPAGPPSLDSCRKSLVAQRLKHLPAMWETWVQSLGRDDPHGNPLQYSCLENPMDGGALWATVHGVAKRWT